MSERFKYLPNEAPRSRLPKKGTIAAAAFCILSMSAGVKAAYNFLSQPIPDTYLNASGNTLVVTDHPTVVDVTFTEVTGAHGELLNDGKVATRTNPNDFADERDYSPEELGKQNGIRVAGSPFAGPYGHIDNKNSGEWIKITDAKGNPKKINGKEMYISANFATVKDTPVIAFQPTPNK